MKRKLQNLFFDKLCQPKHLTWLIPTLTLLFSFVISCIIIACMGRNPFMVFLRLLQGSGLFPKENYGNLHSMGTDFFNFVNTWTPMIFAALAVTVAMKAGLFNIGVAGQMLAAGFIATITVGYSNLPAYLARPLVLLIGLVVGGLMGAFVGFLKHKFNINEVVSTIMCNSIVQYVVAFFIQIKYQDPVSRQSFNIKPAARLSLMSVRMGANEYDISLIFPLAVCLCILFYLFFKRTRLGFEIQAVGSAKAAAGYIGINVGRNIMLTMLISGALAGLAGVTYYLGYYSSIQPHVQPSMGFDSIAVAMLANTNPLSLLLSSFLISCFSVSSVYMSSRTGLQAEIVSLITGLILLFCACSYFIRILIEKQQQKRKRREIISQHEQAEAATHKEG